MIRRTPENGAKKKKEKRKKKKNEKEKRKRERNKHGSMFDRRTNDCKVN